MEPWVDKTRVMHIVIGMSDYVTHLYKAHKTECDPKELADDFCLPSELKYLLKIYVDDFKNESFLDAYNHYAVMEDRENQLRRTFKKYLTEEARTSSHIDFLRECTLHIMFAVELLDENDFHDAPNIVVDAIYMACVTTTQDIDLCLWTTDR